jgi:hypothetical protein
MLSVSETLAKNISLSNTSPKVFLFSDSQYFQSNITHPFIFDFDFDFDFDN